mgnify:CR=1 FL=1
MPTQHNGLPPLHNANSYFFAPPVKNSGRRTDFRGSPGRLETALIPSITRMFKVAFTPRHQARKPATLKDLATIRKALLLGLERGWPLTRCAELGNRLGAAKIACRGDR